MIGISGQPMCCCYSRMTNNQFNYPKRESYRGPASAISFKLQKGRNVVSELCREFGVSGPTGYQWINRYKESGAEGLLNLGDKPHSRSHATPEAIENAILALRGKYPSTLKSGVGCHALCVSEVKPRQTAAIVERQERPNDLSAQIWRGTQGVRERSSQIFMRRFESGLRHHITRPAVDDERTGRGSPPVRDALICRRRKGRRSDRSW